MHDRRSFLRAALVGAALASGCVHAPAAAVPRRRAAAPGRLLVLGGTQYVGAAIVDEALARGHEVTLFNRGLTNPHLFPGLERLRGDRFPDRGRGLEALRAARGRRWDAVVDVSGYFPRQVRASTDVLADAVGRYVFVSSIAVYADFGTVGLREDAPVRRMRDPSDERPTDATYGARKALCEEVVAARFSGRWAAARCHAIVGPHDPGDSLRYWAIRTARGGDVLAPGTGQDPVQLVDVRDVAAFVLRLAERPLEGAYNVVGPDEPLTMAGLLEACRAEAPRSSDPRLVWASEAFLREHRVQSWGDMPLWAPLSEDRGFTQIDAGRARAAGLAPRPLRETIRGVLETTRLPEGHEFGRSGGLPAAREAELLRAWRDR